MPAEEAVAFNPKEFVPELTELDLHGLGLEVRQEGVEWGESTITAEMIRLTEGEESSKGHREGVKIRIPIRVQAEGEVSLAEAAHRLQAVCGRLQDHGGWIRRDFADAGGFAGSLGYKILRHTLSIAGLEGWLFAHRQDAPDIVITATRWPIGYRTDERAQGPFTSEPGERHLIITEAASIGTVEGLWRGRLTNEGAESLRGLIYSRECEYAPENLEDPTAQPHYFASDLTPKGGAVITASAPEVRGVGAVASGAAAISPGLPAGTTKGDLLIMVAESGGATTGAEATAALTAAGWSSPPAPYAPQQKGNTRLTVLYRIATGEDPTATNDTGDHQAARIIGIKAGTFDAESPFNIAAVGTQAATKAVSIPGATTTRDNCLILACASGNLPDASGTAEFSAATNASLSELTERIDNTVTAGDGGAIFAATGVKVAKGTYGATTVTAATEAERGVISLAVNGPRHVEHAGLTAGWLTILDSEISGVGHMTHQGPRRVWMRCENPEVEEEVQLHLLCRALGASRWDDSPPIVTLPSVAGWIPIDVGLGRPQAADLGLDRWEFKLLARAPGGSGKVRLRDVYPLSTEQYGVVAEPYEPARADLQASKLPGSVEDKEVIGTKKWETATNAKTSDNVYATVVLPYQTLSHYLLASNFAFALPETATPLGIIASIERKANLSEQVRDGHLQIMKGGVIGPGTHADRADTSHFWPTGDSVAQYGGSSDTWGVNNWSAADINAANFGVALAVWNEGYLEATASVDQIQLTVYYSESVQGEDRICFASRSMELRSDGIVRQHSTDDVWGGLVPEGSYPVLTAGGLEGRSTRTVLIPSAGDLEELPDGISPPSLKVVTYGRDGYHFAREAK